MLSSHDDLDPGGGEGVFPPLRVGTPLVCVVSEGLVRRFTPSTFRVAGGGDLDLRVVAGKNKVREDDIIRAAYVSDEAIALGLSDCIALIDPYTGKLRETCPLSGKTRTIWGLLPLPQGVATGRAAAADLRLIVGCSTGETHVWQPSRGAKKGLTTLSPKTRGPVYSLAFCPEWDNRVFIAGSGRNKVISTSLEQPDASPKNLRGPHGMNIWGLSPAPDVGMLFTAQTNGGRMAWCRDSETWIKYPRWEHGCTAMYYAKDKHYNLIGSYSFSCGVRRVGVFDTRKPEHPAFELPVSRDGNKSASIIRGIARLTEDVFVSVGSGHVGFWSIAGRGKLLHENALPEQGKGTFQAGPYGVCTIGCDYNDPFGPREDGETPEEINERLAFLLEMEDDAGRRYLNWEVKVGSVLLRTFVSLSE